MYLSYFSAEQRATQFKGMFCGLIPPRPRNSFLHLKSYERWANEYDSLILNHSNRIRGAGELLKTHKFMANCVQHNQMKIQTMESSASFFRSAIQAVSAHLDNSMSCYLVIFTVDYPGKNPLPIVHICYELLV